MNRTAFLKSLGALAIGAPAIQAFSSSKQKEVEEYGYVLQFNKNEELTIFDKKLFRSSYLHLYERVYQGNDFVIREATYKGYSPQKNEYWKFELKSAVNSSPITFPECTGGESKMVGFWLSAPDGTKMFGEWLTSNLIINTGVTPEFAAGSLVIEVDLGKIPWDIISPYKSSYSKFMLTNSEKDKWFKKEIQSRLDEVGKNLKKLKR